MARTVLTVQTPVGPYPTNPVGAGALATTYATGDNTNGNSFPFTGRELIDFRNTTGGAITVTLTSAPDPQGRAADITAYSIPATTGLATFWAGNLVGWNQAGSFFIDYSATGLGVRVIRIPG
jgi:hypothetical protein